MARDLPVASFSSEPEALMWAELLRNEGIRSIVVFVGAGEGP